MGLWTREASVEVNLRVTYSDLDNLDRVADTVKELLKPLAGVEVVSIWKCKETLLGEDAREQAATSFEVAVEQETPPKWFTRLANWTWR